MGPPTLITTIGEARIARRKKFLEERAREEVCPVRPAQSYTQEPIKEEVNTLANVAPSMAANTKGAGKGAPLSKAKPPILLQDGKNAKPQVKYLDEYFIKKGKNPFNLAEAIPGPPKEVSSNTDESWRGFRHPKEPTTTQKAKWDGSSNWSSWIKWKD